MNINIQYDKAYALCLCLQKEEQLPGDMPEVLQCLCLVVQLPDTLIQKTKHIGSVLHKPGGRC